MSFLMSPVWLAKGATQSPKLPLTTRLDLRDSSRPREDEWSDMMKNKLKPRPNKNSADSKKDIFVMSGCLSRFTRIS